MKFIPTSTHIVEEIKKQAKKLQRKNGGKHTDLLEQAAKQKGYLHWHHVTQCAKHTEQLGISSLSAECFYVIQKVKRGENVIIMTGPETAKIPFILFGCNNDVWLFEPKENTAACLMLQGETLPLQFIEENHQQIKIEWDSSLAEITEFFLFILNSETNQEKGYAYPTDILEALTNVLMRAKNIKL